MAMTEIVAPYHTKIVWVQAIRYTGLNFLDVQHFVGSGKKGHEGNFVFYTRDGIVSAEIDDYIVKDLSTGEFSVYDTDDFTHTFDKN